MALELKLEIVGLLPETKGIIFQDCSNTSIFLIDRKVKDDALKPFIVFWTDFCSEDL